MPPLDKSANRRLRSAAVLGIITILSRIFGLIREMVVAIILGTSIHSDAFALAFSLPDLFRRLFAEGALVNGFIPTFEDIKKRKGFDQASHFAGHMIVNTAVLMSIICLVVVLAAPVLVKYAIAFSYVGNSLKMTVLLTQVMVGYIVLISVTSIYQGLLNSFSIFWVSSITPVFLNITVITFALLLSPHLENPAIGFAIGILAGGLIQFLFHIPFVRRFPFKINYRCQWFDPDVKKALFLMAPSVFGVGVYQINLVISNIIASTLQTGSVSSLKFSNRLVELIVGVFAISLATVFLPRLSALFVGNKLDAVQKELKLACSLISFLLIPIAFGGFLLAEEIVTLVFARGEFGTESVRLTSAVFRYHLLGLCFIAWNRIFLACCQAAGLIKVMVVSAVFIIILNTGLALYLKNILQHSGIALSTSISQIIHTVLLVFFLRNHLKPGNGTWLISRDNLLSLVSAGIMLLILMLLIRAEPFIHLTLFCRLFMSVIAGAGVYFLTSFIFKNRAMEQVYQVLTQKEKTN